MIVADFRLTYSTLAIIIVLSSCTKKQSDYARFIPGDALIVTSTNVQSLLNKSGVLKNQTIKDKLIEDLNYEFEGTNLEFMKSLIANPSESGIDLDNDVYYWLEDLSYGNGGVTFGLTDKDKFMKTIEVANNNETDITFTDYNGYSVYHDDGVAIAIGDNFFLLKSAIDAETAFTELKEMLDNTNDNNFASSGTYKKMTENRHDFNMMYSMKELLKQTSSTEVLNSLPKDLPLDEVDFLLGINFEMGKIVADVNYYSESPEWNKWIEKSKASVGKVNDKFMKYFNEDALAVMFCSLNGENAVNMINSIPPYKELFEQLDLPFDLKQLMSTVNGQFALGINSFNLLPEVTLCAEVKSNDIVETMTAMLNGREVSEGKYMANVEMVSIYYGMDGDVLYVSLSPNNRAGIKEVNPSFANNRHAATAKGSYGFAGFNVKTFMMMPYAESLRSTMSPQEFTLLKAIDYVEIHSSDASSGQMVIYTNTDENPLMMLTNLLSGTL